MLGGEAGQGRGQVIAQGHPLLVIVLQGEHALVGTVGIRQELAERIGIFEGRGVQGLEPVGLIDRRDPGQQGPLRPQIPGAAILEPPRGAGFGTEDFGVGHGLTKRLEAGRD